MKQKPIPVEYWFSIGRTIAHCYKRLKWIAAPGYKLKRGRKTYVIDGREFTVRTFEAVKSD